MADDLHYDMKNDDVIRSQEREALLKADPERYADYDTNPYVQARLEEDIDGVLYENAKQQAEEMYYENPIRHYYDEHGYDIYGNDDLGYSVRGPDRQFVDIGTNNFDISDVTHELRMHHLDNDILDYTGNEEDFAKYADYVLPGRHENYREILVRHDPEPAIVEELGNGYWSAQDKPNQDPGLGRSRQEAIDLWKHSPDRKPYESGHFDEPNILAHMRVNDRTINGKKTLMVEEIQSDWHQAGRRKGYDTGVSRPQYTIETDPNGIFRVKDINNERFEPLVDGERLSGFTTQEAAEKAVQENLNRLPKKRGGMEVPDAPFKKNWHEMMVKQALETAAKGDYEAIAFTTGKQQADRYNLSKHIESLSYNPETNELLAYKEGGHSPIINKTVEPDKLSEYVGEEVAKKLLRKELESVPTSNGVVQLQQLSGLDLETGGEGMKGFYDKIIPDYINKYGKKWGMGMKKANLDSNGNQYDDFRNWVIAKDPSMNETFINDSFFKSDDLFKEWLRSGKKSGEEVHFVELSDAAKKDIKEKGQPLFAGIGLGLGTDYMMEPDDQMKTGIFKDLAKQKNN
jgi:hypothetical protein